MKNLVLTLASSPPPPPSPFPEKPWARGPPPPSLSPVFFFSPSFPFPFAAVPDGPDLQPHAPCPAASRHACSRARLLTLQPRKAQHLQPRPLLPAAAPAPAAPPLLRRPAHQRPRAPRASSASRAAPAPAAAGTPAPRAARVTCAAPRACGVRRPSPGNSRWVESMDWSGHGKFAEAPIISFNVDGKDAGKLKSYGPLSFLKVHDAGHMVPMDQPKASLEMLRKWMKGKLAEGEELLANM
uniref:Serine carboxypeptidase-like n=1 Tax=Anthurium amnicola TaxID=1678845 RepID=A0A1D1YDI1_9ARAE